MASISAALTASQASLSAARRRAVLAATIGNALEWYDFLIYGFLAMTIAKLFFPTESELTSLLLSVGTFGAAAVVRPVASVVLGIYADRVGRKAALTLTIFTMGLGTGLIVVAPTYASIGIWAAVLMVSARLLQGFACGGEMGGATAILVENAPDHSRGLYASWQTASQAAGVLLGAMVTMLVSLSMTQAQLEAWGWRLPFAFGLLIVPVGFYIRSKLKEPDVYLKACAEAPVLSFMRMLLGEHRSFVIAVGVAVLYLACAYVLFVYMPTFAVRQLKLPFSTDNACKRRSARVQSHHGDDLRSIRPQTFACRRRIGICAADLSGFRADHSPTEPSEACRRPIGLRACHGHICWAGYLSLCRTLSDALAVHCGVAGLRHRRRAGRRICSPYRDLADRRNRQSDRSRYLCDRSRGREWSHLAWPARSLSRAPALSG